MRHLLGGALGMALALSAACRSEPAATPAPAAASGTRPLAPGENRVFTPQRLGPSPGLFAFDPETPDRLVTCDAESRDGGKTWQRFIADASRQPMLLGGTRRLRPIAGASPRVACADVILPGSGGATGLGAIEAVAEWTGQDWRSAGLRAGGEATPSLADAIAYTSDGGLAVVREDRYRSEGGEVALPGRASAFALSPSGVAYGAFTTPEAKGELMWAPGVGGTWTRVQAPGAVLFVAVAGERAFAAAEMLGRGREGAWDWAPWPRDLRAQGLSVHGDRLVAWGSPGPERQYSGLVVSRDGGATLEYLGAPFNTALTFAAIDPHHPGRVLALTRDSALIAIAVD